MCHWSLPSTIFFSLSSHCFFFLGPRLSFYPCVVDRSPLPSFSPFWHYSFKFFFFSPWLSPLCHYIVCSLLPLFFPLCHRSFPYVEPIFHLQSFYPIYHISFSLHVKNCSQLPLLLQVFLLLFGHGSFPSIEPLSPLPSLSLFSLAIFFFPSLG